MHTYLASMLWVYAFDFDGDGTPPLLQRGNQLVHLEMVLAATLPNFLHRIDTKALFFVESNDSDMPRCR